MHIPGQRGGAAVAADLGRRQRIGLIACAEPTMLLGDGNAEQARSAVSDVVQYSEKAGEAATQSGKKLKQAEISVRKMAHKLLEIKRSVNFEDQQCRRSRVLGFRHSR